MAVMADEDWLLPTSELAWVRFEREILMSGDGPLSVAEHARCQGLCRREAELVAEVSLQCVPPPFQPLVTLHRGGR